MGRDAAEFEVGKPGDLPRQFRGAARGDAQAAHPRVHHQVHARGAAPGDGGLGELLRPRGRVDAGGDVAGDDLLRLPANDRAEDEDRGLDSALAELERLGGVPDADHRGALLGKAAGDGHDAVAVGVRLEHRHHVDATGRLPETVVVRGDPVEVHLGPDSLLVPQGVHPPSISLNFSSASDIRR